MMVPFDGQAPQQGQPSVAPPPIPRGLQGPNNMQGGMPGPGGQGPVPGMPPHAGANQFAQQRRNSSGMQYPPMPPGQAVRNGSFTMGPGPPGGNYSSHPPLHSPHQQQQGPPMMQGHQQIPHPMQQQHRNSMGAQRQASIGGMPPMHDMNRSSGSHGGGGRQMSGGMPPNNMGMPPNNMQQQPPPSSGSRSNNQSSGGSSSQQTGLTGGWQSDRDTPHRREMIQHIVKLLKKDKGGSPDSMSRLPQMAKQLEVSLYRNARSFEAYMDMKTLKHRLQQIAVEVSRKARSQEQKQSSPRDDRRSHGRSDRPSSSQQAYSPSRQQQHSSSTPGDSSGSSRMVNMDEINPMAKSNYSQQQHSGSRRSGDGGMSSSQQNQRSSSQATSSSQGIASGNRNDPEWKMRIRHKQQRLLLLHHSAKCPHEDGRCPATPHCADMKRLWRHMEGCKDNNCRVPHCFSSRAILSHYRKCKDPNCPACGPVRDTVRRSRGTSSGSSSSSMRNMMASTGPMMNSMRGMSPAASPGAPAPPPPQQASGSYGQQQQPPRQSSHSSMPPPGGSSSGMQYSSSQQQQQQQPSSSSSSYPRPSSGSKPSSSSQQPKFDDMPGSSSSSTARGSDIKMSSSSGDRGGSSGGGGKDNSEWQKIRHKQQRLLLLRHASRCNHEAGKCPVTPHCASMKKLWEHIAHCKNQSCTVQHCLSSRYVLSHYRRCKDPRCPACGPVRETIRKSHEREKRQQQNGAPPEEDRLMTGQQASFSQSESGSVTATSPTSESFTQDRKRLKTDSAAPPIPSSSSSGTVPPVPSAADVRSSKLDVVKKEAEKKKAEKKKKDDHSLLGSFTVKELETHLASLDRKLQLPPGKLKSKCLETLKGLQTHQHGWVFNCPVDPVELGLPDYFDIIKKPMDLGTVQKRLDNGQYHEIESFEKDCHLTFDNAMTYNEDGSVVYDMAKELKAKFETDMKKLRLQLENEDQERRQNERACMLCGCEKLLFEPPIYFCNGMNCQSQRIRRNSHFYIGGNNQYFWCSSCYNELDDKIPIELADMTIMKSDLKKKKNDEVHEESWVQCDHCERWVHQICGLFNTRQNKEEHAEYCCPRCLIEKRQTIPPAPKPPGAADLPRTALSEWLEQHVRKRVATRKRELAEEKAQQEGISLEAATREIEEGGPVIIRQVTSMERKLEVRELMQKRYAYKKYPEEFPFRCKCIVVFQRLDGVDVVLFALYVYEHGEDNPPPNQRCVYISYLDSVHFMKPRRMRTFVYHEILIAYLDYARRKGFATAHIWACPPLKGDDYIFYAKPEDQKTPRDSRLRLWYIDMLVECQKRGVVGKVTNMYDLYFADESLDATAVPYMEGDYFPGEAENIIKMIEEGGGKKAAGNGKKKKNKGSKSKSSGTRSTGLDESALLDSGMLDLKSLDRDQVMVKLGETIQPMKESFIVAFLNWSGAKEEDMVVPESIEKARLEYATKDDGDLAGSKRDAIGNVRDVVGSSTVDKNGEAVKIIDDDAEDLDCEFLNNRQAFLNLCRGNHYQFDELRRSKHTSMMVLWHLHNRDAPKFVQQCVACGREIVSGKRYHCNTCPDYDLCQDCYKNPNSNRGSCTHQLQPVAVESDSGQDRSGLTDAERLQRQRNLMLHIQLIEHASRCSSKACSSSNCAKMKNYLQHARQCRVKVQGGCRICKRIWTLLRIHAQKCKDPNCPIPQCTAIREKMRQLQKQQQAMDDRRRMEMNRHMRFSMTGGSG